MADEKLEAKEANHAPHEFLEDSLLNLQLNLQKAMFKFVLFSMVS
jgi:hypothetical protein